MYGEEDSTNMKSKSSPPPQRDRKEKIQIAQLDNLLSEYDKLKRRLQLIDHEPNFVNKSEILRILNAHDIPVNCIYNIVSFMKQFLTFPLKNQVESLRPLLISNIEVSPQSFCRFDVCLIPFSVIEAISHQLKQRIRVQTWANYYFLNVKQTFYVPTRILKQDFSNYFVGRKEATMFEEYFIRYDQTYSTRKCYVDYERRIGHKIMTVFSRELLLEDQFSLVTIDNFIQQYERKHSKRLNANQKEAIRQCINHRSHIICGFPGTGKTTIFDVIKEFMYQYYGERYNIACLAPTGLAIKNLLSKCKVRNTEICGTIHRIVYNIFHQMVEFNDTDVQELDAHNLVKRTKYKDLVPHMIVIDEVSMVDILMSKSVLDFCLLFNTRLVLMGDENQLPPVGPGNVLSSILLNPVVKEHTTYLTDIMRQQDNLLLIENIKRIKENEFLLGDQHFDGKCMFMIDYNKMLHPNTKEVSMTALSAFMKEHQLDSNAQFLSPENNKNCGTIPINKILQDYFNPKTSQNNIRGSTFRVYDKLVRKQNCNREILSEETENDCDIYANGDVCRIVESYPGMHSVKIEYEKTSHTQVINIRDLHDEFALRYCLTIHKSQGGEYDDVILFMGTPHEGSSWKNNTSKKLLYTAVSRAKKRCFIIAKNNLLNIVQSMPQDPIVSSLFTFP
jgi:ATP-dependent exoDNAse (exonuclease V) alpha subunit